MFSHATWSVSSGYEARASEKKHVTPSPPTRAPQTNGSSRGSAGAATREEQHVKVPEPRPSSRGLPPPQRLTIDAALLDRVNRALDHIREGKMVILVDDEDRENEGDLVM